MQGGSTAPLCGDPQTRTEVLWFPASKEEPTVSIPCLGGSVELHTLGLKVFTCVQQAPLPMPREPQNLQMAYVGDTKTRPMGLEYMPTLGWIPGSM